MFKIFAGLTSGALLVDDELTVLKCVGLKNALRDLN